MVYLVKTSLSTNKNDIFKIRMKKLKEKFGYHIKKLRVSVQRFYKNKFYPSKYDYSEITRYSGLSFKFGKRETIEFIENSFPNKNCKILDVGPGQGIYNKLLKKRGYKNIDAVEIYLPYITKFELNKIYHEVFCSDIADFKYDHYDIVIMGDIIEHLKIKKAQRVVAYAQMHSNLVIVAVPYQMRQIGSQLDGSGDHQQSDLTRKIFHERYPGFSLLIDNDLLGVFYSFN